VNAADLVRRLTDVGLKIVTAESCTGGMVAAALTDIAGSSNVFDRGFITYSNDAKVEMLGVDHALILAHGAVSAEVAQAMAEGALKHSRAQIAVSITGIAGPGGGSVLKPVGLVHFACIKADQMVCVKKWFGDLGRDQVRQAAVQEALQLVMRLL
jgi:nicotinamide-nucleotide amidase